MIYVKEFYRDTRDHYSSANSLADFIKQNKILRDEIITIQYSASGGQFSSGNSILLVYEREEKKNG